ncbi:MAG: AraC family transcriptional regulator [Lachnospiraceae bacterium]|nr:AraC family transcriptional regulator [Lachnospiraceae bacterium]
MSNLLFSIFPHENFIDLGMYQYGYEQCDPGHSFGPAARNHYLFHYIISGTGTLMADNSRGETQTYSIKSGQGFMLFPRQISTYIADQKIPWEYVWIEFDGLKVKEFLDLTDLSTDTPVYRSHSKYFREQMMNEMLYIVHHAQETPFHQIGHLYLFLDYLTRSSKSTRLVQSSKMSDYYIKEAIHYIEQNFQNNITIEEIASVCGINRSYFGKIFRKSTGRSPQEFLMNYRMVKATELLKLTSLSIAEIGSAVGYENQLHFSRAFKTIYGISPREWRNQHK